MTNPFKEIAVALLLRGAIFAVLGLVLLARAVPSLLDAGLVLNVSGVVIGALLLSVGVVDLMHGVQRLTRMRKSKLETPPIDSAYGRGSGGAAIPSSLMNADENPNEEGQATLVEWLARVFPKLAYLPLPYTSVLHSVLVAFGLGAAGMLIYVALRVVMAGASTPQQLTNTLEWYLWLYFLIGLGFWATVSRFGFRRALAFQNQLLPRKITTLFLALLLGSVALAVAMARSGTQLAPPPDLGAIVPILWGGSLVVIGAALAIVMLRSQRAPDRYSVHRGEEFFTVGMHPTDMINVIKSFTANLGPGPYVHLGSWKPEFKEHTAVQAGEFETDLNAESTMQLNERARPSIEARLGTAIAWAGILTIAIAGLMLWRLAGGTWDGASTAVTSLRTPLALTIFGSLVYRLGVIPVAELQWTSVLTACRIEGTFQAQGGMALMSAGERTLKGSVLTSASVRPKCAYLTSVGFLQPGLARNTVVRLIDRVEPAGQVANDLLAAIRLRATHMMSAGAPPVVRPAALHALADQSRKEPGEEDVLEARDPV